jgi:hypothetical protein
MSDLRDAAELALTALENTCPNNWTSVKENLRKALAQPEPEPVAWMQVTKYGNKLLAFTEPPLEPPCYTEEFIAAKNYPLFLRG